MKIVIRENKSKESLDMVKYFLSYHNKNTEQRNRKESKEILNKLIGSHDLLVEVKNSLLNINESKREKCVLNLLERIKSLGLDYQYRKVKSDSKSFLSDLFNIGNKNKDISEIMIYIPNRIWINDEFASILPIYGVMYYTIKNGGDGIKLMDDIYKGHLIENDYFNHFSLIVYDCLQFCQMGINAKEYTFKDIKNLLEIK